MLVASIQVITEEKLINFIINGLAPMILHIMSKIDFLNEHIRLTITKFQLQKYEQRLTRNLGFTFDYHNGSMNVATKLGNRYVENWSNGNNSNLVHMALIHAKIESSESQNGGTNS